MGAADILKLVHQCKTADVDGKVDAVTRLQAAFESGTELGDLEEVSFTLRTCLKSPNQHLITATLSALPTFFPLLITGSQDPTSTTIDVHLLKQTINSYLSPPGLIDRLGDSRERAREKARASMVVLGSLAIRCYVPILQSSSSSRIKDQNKAAETPLQIWERSLREAGLQSKVWRVREQAIYTLSQVRRAHKNFPLRPYLPLLVSALEDTDGTVRECARQTVIELFTTPGVTDAARADLKNEMTKRGVRKTIVDSVIQSLITGSGPANGASHSEDIQGDNSGSKSEYVPPSIALQRKLNSGPGTGISRIGRSVSQSSATGVIASSSRPASRMDGESPPTPTSENQDIDIVYIASARDLESEFHQMEPYFQGKETEHNWANRERSIIKVRGMLKGDVFSRYPEAFLAGLKSVLIDGALKTLASLRTTVCSHSCFLFSELAMTLQSALDPWGELIMSTLLRMAGFTKKIVAVQSQATASTIIIYALPSPKVMTNLLWATMQDKNVQARSFAVDHMKAYIEKHGQRLKHAIDSSGGAELLEKCIRKVLGDANIGVREKGRILYWTFAGVWKDRAAVIINNLDATARKQLEKAGSVPLNGSTATIPPTPKKSSVAAQIAASRAKAKAIAAAPPSLMHQATSTSHAVNVRTHSSRPTSPTVTVRSSRAGSPVARSPPRSSVIRPSPPASRYSSASQSPPRSPRSESGRVRTVSSGVQQHVRVPSSSSDTLQKAMQVALPASPPRNLKASLHQAPRRLPTSHTVPSIRHPSGSGPIPTPAPPLKSSPSAPVPLPSRSTKPSEPMEEELLLATTIPVPEDSDSDPDESTMLSFSAAYEAFPPPKAKSVVSSVSVNSPSMTSSSLIVEDALRARAEQAESTAERLLELVEPDEDIHLSLIPPSLLLSRDPRPMVSGSLPDFTSRRASTSGMPNNGFSSSAATALPPSTPPMNTGKRSSVMRQALMFKDSPARTGPISILDVLKERKHETGWWLKRMSLVDKGSPLRQSDSSAKMSELNRYISELESGSADVQVLQKLALLCVDNPIDPPQSPMLSPISPTSPTPATEKFRHNLVMNMWTKDKNFERMLSGLLKYLTDVKDEQLQEYGLIVLWELLDNQASLVEGNEGDIISLLLHIRYSNQINVLEATTTIRDALTDRIEPVYGLTTFHASLRAFLAEPFPESSSVDIKAATHAYALIGLGKFILRLPGEILEEELPRMKVGLVSALNDASSLVVRESAAACIIASQLVLRNETQLFALLEGLSDEKKNLLTYLFDKHGARGAVSNGNGAGNGGVLGVLGPERLAKEMRRLDGRTSTPPRPQPR